MSTVKLRKKDAPKAVIERSVNFNDGIPHVLETLFDGPVEEMPLLKSVGLCQLPNSRHYVSYVIYSRGNQIEKVEVEEPNLRMIAEESTKIAFVKNFMELEDGVS